MQLGAITLVVALMQPAGTKGLALLIARVDSLRSPVRMSGVGTVARFEAARSARVA